MSGEPGSGRLTTHVLDTAAGRPAAGLRIDLFRLEAGSHQKLTSIRTNPDGRCDRPLIEGAAFTPGTYELLFHVGDYFRAAGMEVATPPFLDQVPVRFGIARADQHYHVPLLIAPFAYTTYRGS